VVIPVDMATEFMTKIAGLEGYQPADAAKLADQQGCPPASAAERSPGPDLSAEPRG
jgi:uncharacterized protein YdgA (DUF945 family)